MASPLTLALLLAAAPAPPEIPSAPVVQPPRAEAPSSPGASGALEPPASTPPASTPALAAPATASGLSPTVDTKAIAAPPAREERGRSRPVPRALTPEALFNEVRESSRRRQQDLSAIQEEQRRLEKLQEEVAAARAALREETARLEARIEAASKLPADRKGATGGQPGQAAKSPTDALARTLKGMKPEHAAGVVARLEKPLAVELLRRMRPADAAALLERMKPEAAADFFALLAGDRR